MDEHAWDLRYAGKELVWSAEPNRWVVEEVADLLPGQGLDLACGEGRNTLWLAEQGWTVTGVDFSAAGLARADALARGRGDAVARRLTWAQADLTTYRPEPSSVDLVVVCYLHLPAPDRRRLLRAAGAALRPGGHLLVVGHDTTNPTEGVGGPSDPAVLFTAEDVLADVLGARSGEGPAASGLVVVRAERVGRPTEEGVALDALAHLRRE